MASLPHRPASNRISRPDSANVEIPPRAKSRLESLATELILDIFSKIDHEDIQNFAHCCKRVWEIPGKGFEVHKKRRKYYAVRLGVLRDNLGPSIRPIEFLRDLTEDDGLAIYPKRLVIGMFPHRESFFGVWESLDRPLLQGQKDRIRDMIDQCR